MGFRRLPLGLRGAVLLPAGAYAVHQARYQLAFGDRAGAELQHQGHAYLGLLATPLALVTAIGFGLFLSRVARAWRVGEDERRPARFARTWLTAALLLATLYVAQETLEDLLSSGHPAGLAGIFAGGGWTALPAALAVGAVIAALLRIGAAVVTWAARRGQGRRRLGRPTLLPVRRRRSPTPRRPAPLATLGAGRAPPRLLVVSV